MLLVGVLLVSTVGFGVQLHEHFQLRAEARAFLADELQVPEITATDLSTLSATKKEIVIDGSGLCDGGPLVVAGSATQGKVFVHRCLEVGNGL